MIWLKIYEGTPRLGKEDAYYDQQFDYATAIIDLRKSLNLTQQQLVKPENSFLGFAFFM